ncbi:MAG: sigma-70 family RNA polymerase sigma factor [Planctomycetes bacterium]|nr:sigma-70 family RNA polymerase sigma factor [Planctomycetota bacterium]
MEVKAQGLADGKLVRLTLDGDLSAFDQLVGRYQRQVTGAAYRLLDNMDDAMEVAQDAFLKAFDKLASLSEPDRFGSWILRIVSNLALNRRRARALRRVSSLDALMDEDGEKAELNQPDPKAVSPEDTAVGLDVGELMREAIEELPDMQRQALMMFSVEQMPQKEVAEALHCSVEAVKWHVFTARKKLKERLKPFL